MRWPPRLLAVATVVALLVVFVLLRSTTSDRSTATISTATSADERRSDAPLVPAAGAAPRPSTSEAVRQVDGTTTPALMPVAPPTAAAEAFGRVVDGAGRPVATFVVEARPIDRRRGVFEDDDEAKVRRLAGRDGRFWLDALTEGDWKLVAFGREGARSAPLVGRMPWKGEPPTLILASPVRLEGVVTGRNDAPVEGAEVFLAYAGEELPTPGSSFSSPTAIARSDANGRFSIAKVRPGRLALVASHHDFCNSDYLRLDVPAEAPPEVRLKLRQGARVVGSIDASMGAVADRDVHLYSFNGEIGWRETKSDAAGRFEFEHVIPQEYVIELKTGEVLVLDRNGDEHPKDDAPPGTPKNRGIRKNIEVHEGETTRIDFVDSSRRVHAHGRVTCRGEPLVGAQIRSISLESKEDLQQDVHTGIDGTFALELAGAGRYALSVYLNSADYDHEVTVPDAASVDLSFEVPSGGILGRVVDGEGKPVANLEVTLTGTGRIASVEDGDPRGPERTARTKDDGTFELRMLPPGTFTLAAPDGFQFFRPEHFDPYGRVFRRGIVVDTELHKDVELKLAPEGRISGRILDDLGRTAGGAHLLLKDAEGRACSTYWEVTADESGAFLIRNVAPGTYRVVAWRDGRKGESAPIQVEAQTTAEAKVELAAK